MISYTDFKSSVLNQILSDCFQKAACKNLKKVIINDSLCTVLVCQHLQCDHFYLIIKLNLNKLILFSNLYIKLVAYSSSQWVERNTEERRLRTLSIAIVLKVLYVPVGIVFVIYSWITVFKLLYVLRWLTMFLELHQNLVFERIFTFLLHFMDCIYL